MKSQIVLQTRGKRSTLPPYNPFMDVFVRCIFHNRKQTN